MKKWDILTFIGLVAGVVLVVYGMMQGESPLSIFWDFGSVLITVGGSIGALLINYSLDEMKTVLVLLKESFQMSAASKGDIILRFSDISKKARKDGLLSLEDEVMQIEDKYMQKGLQMVVDGIEPETIKEIMDLEIGQMEARHKLGSDIFRSWGGYAPAFGMIGTLIGLVQMLANLTGDATQIASGMSIALITTFYGAIIANLICLPIAGNLTLKSEKEAEFREMMLEGILSIQSGVNPRLVEEKLVTYLSPKEREEFLNSGKKDEGVIDNG